MSIRLRLTLWYTTLLGTTLILFSVLVYSALGTTLRMQAKDDAERQAVEIAQRVDNLLLASTAADALNMLSQEERESRSASVARFLIERLTSEIDLTSSTSFIQVIDTEGKVWLHSSQSSSANFGDYMQTMPEAERGEAKSYTQGSGDDLSVIYSMPFQRDNMLLGAIQVLQPVNPVEPTLNQAARFLALGTAISLFVAAIVGAVLARQALRPIAGITETASTITRRKDLAQRIRIREDSSEVGRLAATFNEMLDRIQHLFQTQERLTADVSHELRTPLTTIQGNVELLQRMAASEPPEPSSSPQIDAHAEMRRDMLNEIGEESARMNKLVNDLLLLARADSGSMQLTLHPVELDTLLLEVYQQTQRIAERSKGPGSLDVRLGREDQALVLGDRDRLRQLLLNLTENAVKYTPAGGTITLALRNQADWVQVSVQDTGIGIDEESQKNIFSRFYRVDKARSRDQGGTGLGLSIVKWIAEAHHGHVEFESVPGQGSTFTLHLPTYYESAPLLEASANQSDRVILQQASPNMELAERL